MKQRHAFTLIELLIVVAIIAILAAIAVPNFLQAQTRAKTARAKSDMRTLVTAIESYRVDTNVYPQAEINGTPRYLTQLSTPVAYIAHAWLNDPFTAGHYDSFNTKRTATLRYFGFNDIGVLNAASETGVIITPRSGNESLRVFWYTIFCHGPNAIKDNLDLGLVSGTFVKSDIITDPDALVHFRYDPSNGTVSSGEIFRSGGSYVGASGVGGRFLSSHP